MANVAILWNKASDAGALSGGSWAAGLPLANLQTSDVKRVARSIGTLPSATRFRVDAGGGQLRAWSMFVLLGHNLTTLGRVRVVVTNDAADADPAQRTADTGLLPAWEPTIVWGSLPWGAFPWDGVDPTAYPGGALWFHLLPAAVNGRYLWVYIEDAGNAAGYIQAGRFLAGQAWSPGENVEYGFEVGWIDPSQAVRGRQGRRFTEERPRYRVVNMTFGFLTPTEAWGVAFEIQRQIGATGDLFFVADPEEDPAIRFKRSIYAALPNLNLIAQPLFEGLTWRLSLEELT